MRGYLDGISVPRYIKIYQYYRVTFSHLCLKKKKTNREYIFTILPIYTFSCDTYMKLLSGTT